LHEEVISDEIAPINFRFRYSDGRWLTVTVHGRCGRTVMRRAIKSDSCR